MKITNFNELATTDARKELLAIAEAGFAAIDTKKAMEGLMKVEGDSAHGGTLIVGGEKYKLDPTHLGGVQKLVFIAIGKCAARAAAVAETTLGGRITRGVIVDVEKCSVGLPQIKTFCGTHPLPSEDNMHAAQAILEALEGLTEDDLVIFVISGGGSTLLFLPQDRRDRNEIGVFNALTAAGADIREMNIVRKHMSLARGGHLAQYAYPARSVSLIFSDVIGDDLSSIASGPTVKDLSTVEDAAAVLAKYDVLRTCGIENCGLIETPKNDKYFVRARSILAVSNVFALNAMRKSAESMGYRVEMRSTTLDGEAEAVARMATEALHAAPAKTVLLWGGETTVVVRGHGKGGRNLTVSAEALNYIREGEELLSLASDGHDHGPYAGAIADMETKESAAKANVDVQTYVANSDTYPLFEKIGNYLVTGDTGSNVSDLVIALKR